MALTQQQRIDISKQILDLILRVVNSAGALEGVQEQKAKFQTEDENLKIFYDKFNLQTDSYFDEHRWLNGTEYSRLLESDIQDGGSKASGNIFFPDATWQNFTPKTDDKTKGLPNTAETLHELEILNRIIEEDSIDPVIDFMLNGQSSGVANDISVDPYSGGSATIEVTNGGQTNGNFLIISSGGDSALVEITGVGTLPDTVSVSEIIAPAGTLSGGASVIENISGYSNASRQTVTDNVLLGLLDKLKQGVLDWETAVVNSSTAIDANTRPEIAEVGGAKEVTDNTKSEIDSWQAKLDTGVDGKLVDGNIDIIEDEELFRRATYIANRDTEITTELGTLTQTATGPYSGVGVFFDRFIQVNSRIHLTGGPLSLFYAKGVAEQAITEANDTIGDQLNTLTAEILVQIFTKNPTGDNQVETVDPSVFNISDTIFVVADDEPELTGTITNIEDTIITLSFNVPTTYTIQKFGRIYKQL